MTLGQTLKRARAHRGLSLRDVERATSISNGYLSLLESDTVKNPSPNFLHQLAEEYGISYSLLMELAGYAVPAPHPDLSEWPDLERVDDLTADERAQVSNFVRFLRASRRGP
jgi:transcriptional regulator with XRE-family HTH domain